MSAAAPRSIQHREQRAVSDPGDRASRADAISALASAWFKRALGRSGSEALAGERG